MTALQAAEHAHQHWFIEIGPGPKCYLNVPRMPEQVHFDIVKPLTFACFWTS